MSSTVGMRLRMTIYGESHGPSIGIVLDGLPPNITIDLGAIEKEMARRVPGQSPLSTHRKETDHFTIESGFFEGKTTGMALCARIVNHDAHSKDYSLLKDVMRPSHGDYPGYVKSHGANDYRGGGAFSGRLTAPLVFAGAVAKQLLRQKGIVIGAHVARIGSACDRPFHPLGETDETLLHLGDHYLATLDDKVRAVMESVIRSAQEDKDSVGGVIECMALHLPVGLGEPYFDSVESTLSQLLFSIPAVKGVEFGDGFSLAGMRGSEANDPMTIKGDKVVTTTNRNGGILGGLTTGMPLLFRVVVKPTASIYQPQHTVNIKTHEETILEIKGRHDPCIVPRAVPVVEAMTAWALCDLMLCREREL